MKRLRDYSGDRNGEDTNSPACQWFGFLLVIYDLTHFKTMLNTKTSTNKKKKKITTHIVVNLGTQLSV